MVWIVGRWIIEHFTSYEVQIGRVLYGKVLERKEALLKDRIRGKESQFSWLQFLQHYREIRVATFNKCVRKRKTIVVTHLLKVQGP